MKNTTNSKTKEIGRFTPAMLAEQKLTLGDLPPSVYNHDTQTREFINGDMGPSMLPDTLFDGERS